MPVKETSRESDPQSDYYRPQADADEAEEGGGDVAAREVGVGRRVVPTERLEEDDGDGVVQD